jgi:beta-galactosidase GanA
MYSTESTRSSKRAPYLCKQGNAMQLVVDGRPFLILGGELHNSSSSNIEYMRPIWERLLALKLNTVLTPISWELIEPEEGVFDFTLVDGLIRDARRHGLRLIFLWFGSWKNGMSSYIPAWVKQDYRRFPRVKIQNGQTTEVLSTLAEVNWEADARAFARLMSRIREVDSDHQTVIMLQVENEVGVLGDSRDRSEAANSAFAGPVPQELIDQLLSHQHELGSEVRQHWEARSFNSSGSWEGIFGDGPETDEIFMAWHYARYVDRVAAAGKAEYNIPMFVNAWLPRPQQVPGDWPSGGPLPHTLDIWLAGVQHIDLLSPDIYLDNFQEWCQQYTRRGNPLFIPEMRRDEGPWNVFYALGQCQALGTSPFAVDSIEEPTHTLFSKSYETLEQLAPHILEHQGRGEMNGFLLDEEHPTITQELNGYELEISLDQIFNYKSKHAYGLIIAESPAVFIGAGYGFKVRFRPTTPGPARAGILAVDEGEYRNGKWLPGRRLNGDETGQGQLWRFPSQDSRIGISPSPQRSSGIKRCSVYRYE